MASIKISGTEPESIVDGNGLRYVVFTQGCPHGCPGCHNPQTHDPAGGRLADTVDILNEIRENPLLRGVTFSGGEPFLQPGPLLELAEGAHAMGLDVTVYSGYTYEQLSRNGNPMVQALLREADVLIDGPFLLEQRDLTLRFRGSANQRVINLRETRRSGRLVPEHIDLME